MIISDIYVSLVLGTILSLIFVEITGLIPAGIIIPGYLALVIHHPLFVALTFLIAIITYIIVVYGIERVTILYGKRKFAAMIIVSIIVKITINYLFPQIPASISQLSALEVVVPGLIANAIQKQGVIPTVGVTSLLTGITYTGLMAFHIIY